MLLPKPQQRLAHAPSQCESAEQYRDRLADTQIRVELHTVSLAAHVADGNRCVKITSCGLELEGFDGSLAQKE